MKKISTLFKKNPENLGLVINEINPENQWVFDQGVKSTRKYDGMACAIINGELYKRRDVKKGKQIPIGAIECQEADKITGHHPHWIKCFPENKEDELFFEGLAALKLQTKYPIELGYGTYELCGEKISTQRFDPNFNPEKISGHLMIPHGKDILSLPSLEFEALKQYLTNPENDIEGIVFYHPDGRMCKIRKSDFGIKR